MRLPTVALTSLDLSDCSIGDAGVAAISRGLHENQSITSLNLSSNKFGDRGSEALGHALEVNKTLKTLVLDKNTLGERGGRAILKSFHGAPNGRVVSLEQCSFNWENTEKTSKLDPDRPSGHYELNFTNAYDTSVLSRLIKIARRTTFKCFHRATFNGRRVTIDEGWVESNPPASFQDGKMSIDFIQIASQEADPATSIGSIAELITVLGAVHDDQTRLQIMKAVTQEFTFYTGHLPALLGAFTPGNTRVKATAAIWPYVMDWENLKSATKAILGPMQYRRLETEVGAMWHHHRQMPAGRYTLNLSKECDKQLLELLKGYARIRRAQDQDYVKSCQGPGLKRPKWVDTSQHGNREPFRNETLDGAEYQISSDLDITNGGAARQHVPSRGTLVFDMVEVRLASGSPNAHWALPLITEDLVVNYCAKVAEALEAKGPAVCLGLLREACAGVSFRAMQVAQIMSAIPWGSPVRVEVAMALWSRIRDPEDGFYLLFAAGPALCQEMFDCVGWLNLFSPFIPNLGNTPTGWWRADVTIPEQRVVAAQLLGLGTGYDGRLVKTFHQKGEGEKEKKLSEEAVTEMGRAVGDSLLPTRGFLGFQYVMTDAETGAEKKPDLKARKQIAEELGLVMRPEGRHAEEGQPTFEEWIQDVLLAHHERLNWDPYYDPAATPTPAPHQDVSDGPGT